MHQIYQVNHVSTESGKRLAKGHQQRQSQNPSLCTEQLGGVRENHVNLNARLKKIYVILRLVKHTCLN